VTPAEVAASYDQLAERWADPGLTSGYGIPQHERALRFVRTPGAAIDVGCGSSGRIIELLLGKGFDVEGLDVSSRMVELARRRHPALRFHHADVCEWTFPRQYDFISAWDSIWHLPLGAQEPVLRKICGALAPGGVLIFTTGGLDGPGEKRDAAMGPPMYYSVLGISRTLEILAEEQCICRHLEYDQHPELHVYMIAQKRDESTGKSS
jgi:SAM-dependent methyltransferase